MITHSVTVEESHLLLNSAIDTWVACMQTHDEKPPVVKFLHQGKLFLKGHIGRAAYRRAGFGIECQFAGYQAARVQNQIGPFKHTFATYRDQLGISGACSYDFDKTATQRQT